MADTVEMSVPAFRFEVRDGRYIFSHFKDGKKILETYATLADVPQEHLEEVKKYIPKNPKSEKVEIQLGKPIMLR